MLNPLEVIVAFIFSIPYLLLFLISVIVAFYIPGSVLLKKLKADKFSLVVLSVILGISLWALQGFLLGMMHFRIGTYAYLAIMLFAWVHLYGTNLKWPLKIRFKLKISGITVLLSLIFIIGIFGQTQQFFVSGNVLKNGFFIFTAANDDLILHTSYSQELTKNFPPNEPGMYGTTIKNYHYLSNLVIAETVRVFKLPLLATQYQYMYVLMSFLLGAAALVLARMLGLKKYGIIFMVYIQYFASDAIYLLTFITRRVFDFTIYPLEDGTMFLENPPRAFSFVILLGLLSLIFYWMKKNELTIGIALAIMAGTLIGFKVHTGIPVLAGMVLLFAYFIVAKEWRRIFVPILSLMISFALYLPVNASAGSLVFVPFEMARMFAGQEALKITHFELARQIYAAHKNTLQALRMELTMLVIFLIFQFGIRVVGFFPTYMKEGRKNPLYFFFMGTIALVSLILGTFFIQPVAGADIFNFYLVLSLMLSIFTAFTIQRMNTLSYPLKILIIVVIFGLTLPRFVHKTSTFSRYFSNGSANISIEEIDAMEYVKNNTDPESLILVDNVDSWDGMYPYVSIFTQRPMFLSGQVMMSRHGISYSKRENIVNSIKNATNEVEAYRIVKKNNIDILYFYKGGDNFTIIPHNSKKIYENNKIAIYHVQ